MVKLISLSRQSFDDKCTHLKLPQYFWCLLRAYFEGYIYDQGLKMYFSNLCTQEV